MKTTTFIKAFIAMLVMVTAGSTSLFAQLRVGNSPTSIDSSAMLELEPMEGLG